LIFSAILFFEIFFSKIFSEVFVYFEISITFAPAFGGRCFGVDWYFEFVDRFVLDLFFFVFVFSFLFVEKLFSEISLKNFAGLKNCITFAVRFDRALVLG